MWTFLTILAAFATCWWLNSLPVSWCIGLGIAILFAVRYGTHLYVTRGSGEVPPIKARLFGRIGANMDGDTLLTFAGRVWGRSPYTDKWKRFDGG